MRRSTDDLIARLLARSVRNEETGCLVWTGPLRKGYGSIGIYGVGQRRVHLAAWIYTFGPVPTGLELDHLCHTRSDCDLGDACQHRACWNVEHLEPVPHTINVLRGQSPAGKNAKKTHCIHGHPFSGPNLLMGGDGRRICRECRHRIDANRPRRELKYRLRAQGNSVISATSSKPRCPDSFHTKSVSIPGGDE